MWETEMRNTISMNMFVFNGPERIKRVEKKIDKNLKPYMRKIV
jgi:hypothetical protein